MNIGAPIVDMGRVDVTGLRDVANTLTDEDWLADRRVSHFATHTQTRILPFVWPTDLQDASTGRKEATWRCVEPFVVPIVNRIETKYGQGLVSRAMLACLVPGAEIAAHADGGGALRGSHRFHVPVVTNSDVIFVVGGIRRTMVEGNLYEINNQMLHQVSNNGHTPRIHLILDFWHADCKCDRHATR